MSSVAKSYIAAVVAAGTGILLLGASSWPSGSMNQFAALLSFTVVASTLKVRIPGMTSTISPSFAFLLVAMAYFSLPQVVVAALAASLTQSLWRAKSSPRLVQVVFSAAALVVSSAFAFGVSHLVVNALQNNNAVALVLLAGPLYMFMNTLLISVVVGLTEHRPVKEVCQGCYEWAFPYFAFGIFVIGLMSGSFSTLTAWRISLEVTPAMVLGYLYFLSRSNRRTASRSAVHEEEQELVAV